MLLQAPTLVAMTTRAATIVCLLCAAAGSASGTASVATPHVSADEAPLLAYWNVRGGDTDVHVIRADGSGHRVITNNRLNNFLAGWSPDGHWLVYTLMSRRGVTSYYARDVDRSGLVYIGGMIGGAGWSPDARRVLTEHRTSTDLQVVDMETGTRRLVSDGGWGFLEGIGWSPDGRTILFAARRYNDFDVPKVFAADADGSRLRRLARNGRAPSWSPDGRWIGFLRDVSLYYSTVYVVRPDGSGLRRLSPVRIPVDAEAWRWSPDGRTIAIEQELRNSDPPRLGVLDVERGGVKWLTRGKHYQGEFRWLPDSKRILYPCGASYDFSHLCMVQVETGRIRKLTVRVLASYSPRGLSADGKRIAFSNDAGVFVLEVASGMMRRVVKSAYFESWSPDGEWMLVQRRTGAHVVIRLQDGSKMRINASAASRVTWQPRP